MTAFPGLPEEVTYEDLLRVLRGDEAKRLRIWRRDAQAVDVRLRVNAFMVTEAARGWLSDGGEVSERQVRSAFARAWLVAYCPADRFETLTAAAERETVGR